MKRTLATLTLCSGLLITMHTIQSSENPSTPPTTPRPASEPQQIVSRNNSSEASSPHSKHHHHHHHNSSHNSGTSTPDKQSKHFLPKVVGSAIEHGKDFIEKHKRSHSPNPSSSSSNLKVDSLNIKDAQKSAGLSLEGTPNISPRKDLIPSHSPQTNTHLDAAKEATIAQSSSAHPTPTNSPRPTQIQPANASSDTQIPSIQRSNSKTSFTNNPQNIPCYECINSKDLGNNQSEITYVNNQGEKEIKVLAIDTQAYNDQRYLNVEEENQGGVEKYNIDLKGEEPSKAHQNQSNLYGYLLTLNHDPYDLAADVPTYKATHIEKVDNLTLDITYTYIDSKSNESRTISVSNTATPTPAKVALICHSETKKPAFAIDLTPAVGYEALLGNRTVKSDQNMQNNDKPEKSHTVASSEINKKPSISSQNRKISGKTVMGGLTFVALCVLLAYKYNQLPAAFENLLNQFFAQIASLSASRK
ncbi:MAG TPA: hypothetical protein VHX42_01475 [Candidatus Babeliales bacterium]|jgi:hypothetical protein|nr:hypothetical protein [Candidatus Babeliales bacterium]